LLGGGGVEIGGVEVGGARTGRASVDAGGLLAVRTGDGGAGSSRFSGRAAGALVVAGVTYCLAAALGVGDSASGGGGGMGTGIAAAGGVATGCGAEASGARQEESLRLGADGSSGRK
jgi:hypothetical protein